MLKLGKRPARAGAIRFGFTQFFAVPSLPTPPPIFGRPGLIAEWGMLGNDRAGNCVWAGGDHETMLLCAWAGQPVPRFTPENALGDYGSTGYDGTDATDNGTDMQQAASYRRTIGLIDADGRRHKIDAYVALRPEDLNELALSTYLLGVAGVGLQLPSSALDQFNAAEPWAPVANSPIEGGHYVPCVGRNSHGNFIVVTWGRLHAATPEFLSQYMDEGVAYLSFEQMRGNVNPRGFDEARLQRALSEL